MFGEHPPGRPQLKVAIPAPQNILIIFQKPIDKHALLCYNSSTKEREETKMIKNEIYTGAVHKIYENRTIVLPKELCNKTGIFIGDIVETDTGEIILRPYDPRKRIQEKIKKADKVLQALNSYINIIVFDKANVIYSSTGRESAPIDNYAITETMGEEWINTDKLKKQIQRIHPHANISVDDKEGLAIAIVNSMGEQADEIIFNYLWKNIKK